MTWVDVYLWVCRCITIVSMELMAEHVETPKHRYSRGVFRGISEKESKDSTEIQRSFAHPEVAMITG